MLAVAFGNRCRADAFVLSFILRTGAVVMLAVAFGDRCRADAFVTVVLTNVANVAKFSMFGLFCSHVFSTGMRLANFAFSGFNWAMNLFANSRAGMT